MRGILLVFAKLHRLDRGPKTELTNVLLLMVVPEHYFVRRELGSIASSRERQDVTSKEHFDDLDASFEVYNK